MDEDTIKLQGYQKAMQMPRKRPAGTFQEHIQSLKLWETSLLANVQLTEDPFTLTSQIAPNATTGIATDGAVLHQQGTFRWTLSMQTGTFLITCSSPVYRCSPTS